MLKSLYILAKKNIMKQHIVTNKFNKKQYQLNDIEVVKFFEKQDITNYTIKDKLTIEKVVGNIIAFLTVALASIALLMLGSLMDRL